MTRLRPQQVSCSQAVWQPYQVGTSSFYGYLSLCHRCSFPSIFRKSHLKKSKELSTVLNSITILDKELACIASLSSLLSTMQHFKVLLVLLFVAAVGISLTQAWTMNSQRIGKRKQIFFRLVVTVCLALSCQVQMSSSSSNNRI